MKRSVKLSIYKLTLILFAFAAPFNLLATVKSNPLNFPGAANAKIGIYIEDLSTGEVLYDVNGLTPLLPASITKSITTASILTLRDSSFRYNTEVVIEGLVEKGNLKGNVIVRCVGDPTIESSHFKNTSGFADSIAAALASMGIKNVEGTVIIDESKVPYSLEPKGWVDEDIVWPYGSNHYGANYKDNKFVLNFSTGTSTPFVPDLRIAHTPAKGALRIRRDRGTSVIRSEGTSKKNEAVTVAMPNPGLIMRNDIILAIKNNEITIGEVAYTNPENNETLIYVYESPQLNEILRSLMFRSDNMMAESMLRLIAPGKTRAEAVKTELEMWELRDIDTEQIVLEDGSGLSRNDRLTPYFMADVFEWMASHVKAKEFISLFPKAGKDGTMRNFLKETPLEGKIAMKTGSMKRMQSYAGYKLGEDGLPTHIIVFMINGFDCDRSAVVTQVENLLLKIFEPNYQRPIKETRPVVTKKNTAQKSNTKKQVQKKKR